MLTDAYTLFRPYTACVHEFLARHPNIRLMICTLLGALTPLAFAPYHLWFISFFSVGLFAIIVCFANNGTRYVLHAFAFALGYFGVGVSWVFYSIYYFGSASFLLAILLTSVFVTFVALVFALPFYALKWITPRWQLPLGIPLLWVVSEWIRTWLLTGFPWLLIGYPHINTVLSGWAPIGGVLLISLLAVASSCLLTSVVVQKISRTQCYYFLGVTLLIWATGYSLKTLQWTTPLKQTISVGVVQPNIPQNLRWVPEYQEIIKQRLWNLSEPFWKSKDWIIWPEGALPHVYHQSTDFIEATTALTKQYNTSVITGVIYDDADSNNSTSAEEYYFNSMIGIGDSEGIYHKQRLVPFGEYVPLEQFIRGMIEFFDLPFSVISPGGAHQKNLTVQGYSVANAICYEIAYPSLVAKQVDNAHVLITVSNDAWFGDSIGPLQHFQMVRMRALETGRYIIRGTNNGISAIIQPNGQIQQQSAQFIMTNLSGTVTPVTGRTPFMLWKNYLVLSLLMIIAFAIGKRRRDKQH